MKKIITALSAAGLACALALIVVATASAANVTATVGVTAGTLSMSTSATPSGSVTLNGTDQNTSFGIPLSVTDATGSGAGWNVTITSTQFSAGGGKTLSTSASTITGVVSACNASVTCTNPTNAITYPLAVPAGAGPPTAVKLFNAAAATGMGGFTVTPTMQVAVPANTLAGSYTSTVTVAIVSGP